MNSNDTRQIKKNLREVFGLEKLRPGQREVIEHILDGEDVLAIMPTGAGKSLCSHSTCSSDSFCSDSETLLLRFATSKPFSSSLSDWSFINEMSGETTIVIPSICKAGSW